MMTPDDRAERAIRPILNGVLSSCLDYERVLRVVAEAIREAEERGRKAGREELEAEIVRSFAGYPMTVNEFLAGHPAMIDEFLRRAREIGGGP